MTRDERIREILTELRCSQNKHITGDVDQALKEILYQSVPKDGKCAYCPYIKVVSFTPDSELAKKVIDELQQEISRLKKRELSSGYHNVDEFYKE